MSPHTPNAIILAVDTSSSRPGVALARATGAGEEPATVASEYLDTAACNGEQLAACIEGVLEQAGVSIGALTALAVTQGPGSFTGVRVGLALVRGMALVDDLPVVGVGSLELVALACPQGRGRLCAIAQSVPGKLDKLYVAGYERAGNDVRTLREAELVESGDLGALLRAWGEGWTLCGEAACARVAAEPRAADVRDPGADYLAVPTRRAGILAQTAVQRVAAGQGEKAERVLPRYVGATGARPNRNRVVLREPRSQRSRGR